MTGGDPFDHAAGLAALDHPGPLVMGILNVTPDSFSDGGRWAAIDGAVAHAHRMLDEGAHVIDIGGESSRPGAAPVSVDEELSRVLPVIERLAGTCVMSIDTAKAEVASEALAAGAVVLNDISASLEEVAAAHGAGWIAMHMQGEPRTMHLDPSYGDVVAEVRDALADAVRRGRDAGVPRVWIDPGIGFGKTIGHNLELLHDLGTLSTVGARMVVGVSRKRWIGQLHAASDGVEQVDSDDRLPGSVLGAMWALRAGAHIIRVHDVRATVLAADLVGPAGRTGRTRDTTRDGDPNGE